MAAFPVTRQTPKRITGEEFMRLPEPEHGGKMELVDGVVRVMSPVGLEHGEVAGLIYDALRDFARKHRLGRVTHETGFRLRRRPDRVLAPDVSVLFEARRPRTRERRESFVEGPPDLAVEVVSPSDRQRDVLEKVGQYLDGATPRVWVVRPRRQTVTVYRQSGEAVTRGPGDILSSDDAGLPVEGFRLPVADIFEE
jgi:Uma2 family endonuclease